MGAAYCGFRVIRVDPGSPLEEAGLQSYLHLLLSANGVPLVTEDRLANIITKSVDCPILLRVLDVLTRNIEEKTVVPREWGGPGLLGGSVRFEEWTGGEDFGVRVLEVQPGSPAAASGLQSMQDFILGSDEVTIASADQLSALTLKTEGQLGLYVYNLEQRKVRRVVVTLTTETPLGVDVGQGALHALDFVLASTPISQPTTVEQKEQAPPPEPTKQEEPVKTGAAAALRAQFEIQDSPGEPVAFPEPQPREPHTVTPAQLPEMPSRPPPPQTKDSPPPAQAESVRPARPMVNYVPARIPLQLPALKDPFQTGS